MNTLIDIPVLICAHSRESEFQRLLSALIETGCAKIYVNIDASSQDDVNLSQQRMMKHVIAMRDENPEITINARISSTNLGAAVSVIAAADWFFESEDFGLIFEDDLEYSDLFFDFASWARDKFVDSRDVWIIAGSNFFSTDINYSHVIHAPNYPVTWGWGTWAKKWEVMRIGITEPVKSIKNHDPLKVRNFWLVGADRSRRGYLDAWDIPLAQVMKINQVKSLVPPKNLIRNIGFTEFASNTKEKKFPLNLPLDEWSLEAMEENLLDMTILSGRDVDSDYERFVYKIRFRHSFSKLISRLDSKRFRDSKRDSLGKRLERINESSFQTF